MKKLISLFLSIIIIISLAGCGKPEGNDNKVYICLPSIPRTLDPQTAESPAELLIVANLFEGLVRLNEKGEICNGLAESYEKKGNSYTFKLNPKAAWDTGDRLYAEDFAFGLMRALDRNTASPFYTRFMSISGAEEFRRSGDSSALGITVVDKNTLKITLSRDDPDFLYSLTTAPAMPCDEEFFNSCEGRYGLDRKSIIASGSYYLGKWNQTDFGIRIYRNAQYFGDFKARNGGVFMSVAEDTTAFELLSEGDTDIAFIDTSEIGAAKKGNFKMLGRQNICWVLTLSPNYSSDIRKALAMLIDRDRLFSSLDGLSPATTLLPETVLGSVSAQAAGYNAELGRQLFSAAIKNTDSKVFPKTTLYYYNSSAVKPIINDMIGHWQQNLSAFINMEASDNLEALQKELKQTGLQMAVFPITAASSRLDEYLTIFGAVSQEQLASLCSENIIIPLCFEQTTVAYRENLSSLCLDANSGILDISFVLKAD